MVLFRDATQHKVQNYNRREDDDGTRPGRAVRSGQRQRRGVRLDKIRLCVIGSIVHDRSRPQTHAGHPQNSHSPYSLTILIPVTHLTP